MEPIERPQPHQRIPPEAQKVFSGILYDVYHWQQQRFDGTFDTWERLKRKEDSAVILPVTKTGKILILEEQQSGVDPYLTLPAGQIKKDEDPLAGAAREFSEETGYASQDWELLSAIQIDARTDWAVYTFIARECVKVGDQNLDPAEKITVKEVSVDEFLRLAAAPEFRVFHILKDLLAATLTREGRTAFEKRLGL